MSPWWLRQLAVFGSISPSTASGRVLFIRDIGEWNSITAPATLDHLLGMGIGPFLATRIGGLVSAVMIFTTLGHGLRAGPVHGDRRLGPTSVARLRPVLRVCRAPLRLLDGRLGGACPGWHVHPFGGRPRAPCLHPHAGRGRGGGRVDRGASSGVGSGGRHQDLHRRDPRVRRRGRAVRLAVRARGLGRQS